MAASVVQVLAQVQRWTSPRLADFSDTVLLERFVQRHEEAAFAELVARHGAMVLRSCRRVLGDVQASEDAFQATFLVLARKAHTLRQPEALPGWLHGVARRVALKARTRSTVRASQTSPPETLSDPRSDPLARVTARELLTVLDEEVQRLPSAQRSAVVLCCLEGHPQEEAARLLGWTAGSLKGHLERGRRRLHERLTRRGIALPAVLAVVAVSRGESASALLQQSAVRAALGGAASNPAAALAESVLKRMAASKFAGLTAFVVTIALAASVAELAYRTPAEAPAPAAAPQEAGAAKPEPRVDALGDPLPEGARARLGTLRFRHGGGLHLLAFTPDGKRLVSQGNDGVRVWDPDNGKQLRFLAPPEGATWGASDLSSDGKLIAATFSGLGLENPLRLWDLDSGKLVGTLDRGFCMHVRFSPDGKWLAVSSGLPPTIELWDMTARKKVRSWKAHPNQIWSVAFSTDSRKLLTGDTERNFRLWDVASGRQLQEFTPSKRKSDAMQPLANASLSPDGKLLAIIEASEKREPESAAGWSARISLRDAASGKRLGQLLCPFQKKNPNHVSFFYALAFTPDGKSIVTSGPDEYIRFWDVATRKEVRRLPADLPAHTQLAFSKDGEKLALKAASTAIQVVDLSRRDERRPPLVPRMAVEEAILASDGRTALTGGKDGGLLLWQVKGGRLQRALAGHDKTILKAALARDERTLIAAGTDNQLHTWDLATGEELRRAKLETTVPTSGLAALALAPDGEMAALVYPERTIRLLDVASGEERRRFDVPQRVWGLAFTPDGRSLTGWSGDRKVRVWDVKSGRCLRTHSLPYDLWMGNPFLPGDGKGPSSFTAAVSPDGRLLAMEVSETVRSEAKPEIYLLQKDLLTGRTIRRDKLSCRVGILAFSPDGRTLAWSGDLQDWSIHLLEVASGRERRRFAGHRGRVAALNFSASGAELISGSEDTTALVWNLRDNPDFHPLSVAEVEALWTDIGGEDAARAYQAIHKLAAAPNTAVPFLRKRLQPVSSADETRIARLIADLDSADFAIRNKAAAQLEELRDRPLPAYRKAVEGKPSLETRRRLEDLLEKGGPAWWDVSGERLRSLRAVEVLELAGTKEAREVLESLAGGASGVRLTEQAKAALERLARR